MSHHEWNINCVLCIFQHFISKLPITKMQSYNLARLANVGHIQAMKDWLLYCTSRGCSSCFPRQGGGDWNEFFILASFQGQIAYWFHFFVYYGGLVHAKNRSALMTAAHISMLIDFVQAVASHTKPRLVWRGSRMIFYTVSQYMWAVEQRFTWAHPLTQFFRLQITRTLQCSCFQEKKKWTQGGGLFYSSIERDLMESIQVGGNDEQWLRQSKDCFCIRRHEKGKSHCDPVSEQQPFWLLSSWNVFSTLCVYHCSEWELIDFFFSNIFQLEHLSYCWYQTSAILYILLQKKIF